MTRYALYFAPPSGAFADTAARWLGRDAISGAILDPDTPELWPLTASARRYGFHATIKAPFRLAEGVSEAALISALDAFAARHAPVRIDALDLASLGGFLALIPQGDTAALNAYAARVVEHFDPMRAALTPAEIARRNPAQLSARQRALLDLWGYPHVMDEFQFHMTLTDRLNDVDRAWVQPRAELAFAPYLGQAVMIDALNLFVENAEGAFHQVHRAPLSGS